MNRTVTFTFLKSTLVVIFVAILGGLFGMLVGLSFWSFFLLFCAVQYILFYISSTLVESYFKEKTKQKQLDKLENLSTILNCAYCNKPNLMIFTPEHNNRIEFKCEHCKKPNLVTLQFVVARITEPVNIPKTTGTSLE